MRGYLEEDTLLGVIGCATIVLFRDSLLPRPENGPGTQAGQERVLYYLQAHARNEPIRLQKIEQRRLLSDWLLKIVASSFQTARIDVNKDGVRSDDFNFVLLPSFVLYLEGGLFNLKWRIFFFIHAFVSNPFSLLGEATLF